MAPNDSYPQHVVTAVIVAHDGAEWLPRVTDALLGQTRPVQRIVAVDTGSRDRSGTLLADLLGHEAVFGMDRTAGYGAAVARALQHRAATVPVPSLPGAGGGHGQDWAGQDWGGPAAADDWAGHGSQGAPDGEPVEWIWLLHDDSEPDPGALEALLRGVEETPGVAVVGPKVLDWSDRQVILEAGLAIDTAGRRISGTEPREIDQGQHDGDRDVLAVGSAGMLARRDVWDEVGGFDTALSLFREDVDFCWRVHAAGYRVRVITDAVVYHLEAAARSRRQISAVQHPRRADRRNALIVLLANLPVPAMIAAAAGNTALSAARILFFLLGKRPEAAKDEAAAFGFLIAHPGFLLGARRRRRWRGRRRAYGALRSQVPRGRSLRMLAEFAAATLYPSSRVEAAGSHHVSDDPSDDDSLLTDSGFAQRILTNPCVLLLTGLVLVSLIAERSLLGSGPLGGGALLPSWGGASGLWGEYLTGFHPIGVGSAASTPPYIAVIAALSTVLAGKPWLAVEVILLGCVPFSGLAAYLASRRFTKYAPVRVWLAASYALLPVATGAIAAGRLGTAVVFILMPLIASAAGRMLTQRGRQARRAAWATGLLIAVASAFVPLVWVVAVVIAAFAGLALARNRRAMAANLAIVALVPPVLLAPWTLNVAGHPALLLLEAGLQPTGLASKNLSATSLLLLNPGGPGTPPVWVAAGLVLAALAALLLRRRGFDVFAAWGIALSGLLTAIAVSRFVVSPPGGGPAVPAWPGVALLFAAAGLLLAVASVGGDLYALFAAGGLRKVAAIAMAAVASAPPVLAAVFWIGSGVASPLARVAAPVLPQFVSIASANGARLRTLVLRPDGGTLSYTVLRGNDPPLGAGELTEPAAAGGVLSRVVAALGAPNGNSTGNLGGSLAEFDIGYILLPAPIDQGLARQIDGVVGLRPVSQTSTFELWKVVETVARLRVTEPGGAQVALPSGTVNVTNAAAPSAGGTLVLAEPASGSWQATLNGHPLTALPSPVDGWAQGFRLPSGGGLLSISRDETGRTITVALEFVLLLIVAALALPGAKDPAPVAAEAGTGRSRRASRADALTSADVLTSAEVPASAEVPVSADMLAGAGAPARAAGASRSGGGGGGKRGVRGRDNRPAGTRRGGTRGVRGQGARGQGARVQGRRRRTDEGGAEDTGPYRVPGGEDEPQGEWALPDPPLAEPLPHDSPWADPVPPDLAASGDGGAQYSLPLDDDDPPAGETGWPPATGADWSPEGPVSQSREADW